MRGIIIALLIVGTVGTLFVVTCSVNSTQQCALTAPFTDTFVEEAAQGSGNIRTTMSLVHHTLPFSQSLRARMTSEQELADDAAPVNRLMVDMYQPEYASAEEMPATTQPQEHIDTMVIAESLIATPFYTALLLFGPSSRTVYAALDVANNTLK